MTKTNQNDKNQPEWQKSTRMTKINQNDKNLPEWQKSTRMTKNAITKEAFVKKDKRCYTENEVGNWVSYQ